MTLSVFSPSLWLSTFHYFLSIHKAGFVLSGSGPFRVYSRQENYPWLQCIHKPHNLCGQSASLLDNLLNALPNSPPSGLLLLLYSLPFPLQNFRRETVLFIRLVDRVSWPEPPLLNSMKTSAISSAMSAFSLLMVGLSSLGTSGTRMRYIISYMYSWMRTGIWNDVRCSLFSQGVAVVALMRHFGCFCW